jgi:hypothetical protein
VYFRREGTRQACLLPLREARDVIANVCGTDSHPDAASFGFASH